ncbi:MAG TPA: cytochrome c oxidase subunit II [Sphingomonadales bacterium]
MNRLFRKTMIGAMLALATLLGQVGAAQAAQPEPWQTYFQEAASEVMHGIVDLHDLLLVIITGITVLVMALLLYVILRFRRSANPVPSKTSHNTLIEVIWTLLPVLILVAIAIPSFKLLYLQDKVHEADLTIKATGSQWYWSYEYPDHDGIAFDSLMLTDEEAAAAGEPRLLATDTRVVVPVGKVVRVLVTASDVLHAWAVPAFGVKIDAVPGRLNETWFRAEREGIYYGQCSELCGIRHAFMPIAVEVVSEERFAAWLEEAKEQYAMKDATKLKLAAAQQR